MKIQNYFFCFLLGALFIFAACKKENDTFSVLDVENLSAVSGDSKVILTWSERNSESIGKVLITFEPNNQTDQPIEVNPGKLSVQISGLEDEIRYTFTVTLVDKNNNRSNGITIFATPFKPQYEEPTTLLDERDNHIYNVVKIGDQIWMAENLAYIPEGEKFSASDDGSNVNDFTRHYYVYGLDDGGNIDAVNENPIAQQNFEKYGILYNWYAVIDLPDDIKDTTELKNYIATNPTMTGIAPKGWHIPSDDEFKTLEMTLGMTQEEADKTGYRGTNSEGNKIKSQAGWDNNIGTNDVGFGLLPNGRWKSKFLSIDQYAYLWTSSFSHINIKIDENGNKYPEIRAWLRYVRDNDGRISRNNWEHFNGYAVRCIKDQE